MSPTVPLTRDKRKSGLSSAEVIRGHYDRETRNEVGGQVGKSTNLVDSVEEEPAGAAPGTSTLHAEIPWDELVSIVKGEPHLTASVPGDYSILNQSEAARTLSRRLDRTTEQVRMVDELKRSAQEDLGQTTPTTSDPSNTSVTEIGSTGLPGSLSTREKLLDVVLPLCSNETDARVRTAGFELLASALRLCSSAPRFQHQDATKPCPIAHTPWALAGTILDLFVDLPRSVAYRYNLTDTIPSSETLDLYGRTACLVQLTGHGRDISANLDMIKVMIRWLKLLSAEWVRACSRRNLGKGMADTGGSVLGLVGTSEGMEQGRRGSRAGVGQRESVSRSVGRMERSGGRVQADLVIPLSLSPGVTVTKAVDPVNPEHTLKTILQLSELLLNVMKNNLALFTPNDTSHILNMYLDTIKRGIRYTPDSHPLLNPSFAGYGRSELMQIESKTKTSFATQERTSSVLGSLRKPSKIITSSAISTTSLPATLSRHPSTRSKGEKGFATTAVSTGSEALIDPTGLPEEKPYWSTMIPFLIELVRTLLNARSLSPLDLPAIMSLLSLCSGWRALSTHSSFRLDGGDRAIITNALDLRDRDGIVSLVRDVIVSRMIGRSGEKALRGVLGMDRGRGREKSTYHVGRDEGLRGRDRLLGVIW
jgi:hypothetical protein